MNIYQEYPASWWPLQNDPRLSLVCIDASGETLDDLLSNCYVMVEDWNGNEVWKYQALEDLPSQEEEEVTNIIMQRYAERGLE